MPNPSIRPLRLLGPAVAAAAALWAGAARAADPEPFTLVGADEVQKLLAAPDVHVYDVNTAQVYAEAHLPGARHVSSELGAKDLPADKGARLVFYCKNPH